MNETPRYATLQDYLRVIRERRLVVILVTVLVAGAALLYSARQELTYEASAYITPNDISQDIALLGSGAATNRPGGQQTALYAARVTSEEVTDAVRDRLGVRPGEPLGATVSTRVEASTGFVLVVAQSSAAPQAARVADAYAVEATESIVKQTRDRFALAAKGLGREIKKLGDEERNSINYAVLQQRQFQLIALSRFSEPVSLGRPASVPDSPVAPKPVRNTLLGGVFGLILGLLLAFVRDSLDVRLRHANEVGSELDLPVVGRVRDQVLGSGVQDESDPDNPHGPGSEAFSILRTNLEFIDPGNAPCVVLVTSAVAEEGKSTVAVKLAAASAASGRRTLLVDADLRRPVVALRTGVEPKPGLADYLAGQCSPGEVLRVVPMPGNANGTGQAAGQLVCIPAGTNSPRISEMLTSERFETFLKQVRAAYDLVIVDSPPVLAVADPLQIVPHVDAVLLCVRLQSTRRSEAVAARDALRRAPDRPTGVVVTGVRTASADDYAAYGYAYYRPTDGDGSSGRRRLLRR